MRSSLLATCVLVIAGACGDDAKRTVDAHVPDMRPPPDADTGAVPRVEDEPCRFEVPQSLGAEGVDYACGDLVVEEHRDAHTGRIRLHYIRIKSSAIGTNRATIYLDGGPGGDGQGILDYIDAIGPSFLAGLLVDGDFLVIGQRGTRRSRPFLDCDFPSCSNLDGIADLTAYNTAYNADDIDDLRGVLGLDQLNIYGISYGSRLGLEYIRRHGEHVRAAVIEGLVPAQTVWPAAIPASMYGALTALHESCASAGACGTSYGDLVAKFVNGVDSLNIESITITGPSGAFDLDGYTYAYMLQRMLYARSTYTWLPLVINDLAQRRTDRVGTFIATWFDVDRDSRISRGLYYSVVCGELYNPPTPSAFDTANAGVPDSFIQLYGGSYYALEAACASWPKNNLASALAQPVTSSVRTLVSSGRLDPITPPSFGTVVAATLDNSVSVIHENSGHGATLQSECGAQNLHAFLADPGATLDTSCAATITNDYTLPAMVAGTPIAKARLRAEAAMIPLPHLLRR